MINRDPDFRGMEVEQTPSVDPPEREIEKSDERCPFLRVVALESEAGILTGLKLKCAHEYLLQYPKMLGALQAYRSLVRVLFKMSDPPQFDGERLFRYGELKREADDLELQINEFNFHFESELPRK